MATVVMVTKVWIFFSPFGPKTHLLAKFRENRAVNNVRRAWPTFALYYININRTLIRRPLLGRENSGLLNKVVSLLRVPVYKAKANGPTKKQSSFQGGLLIRVVSKQGSTVYKVIYFWVFLNKNSPKADEILQKGTRVPPDQPRTGELGRGPQGLLTFYLLTILARYEAKIAKISTSWSSGL